MDRYRTEPRTAGNFGLERTIYRLDAILARGRFISASIGTSAGWADVMSVVVIYIALCGYAIIFIFVVSDRCS